MPSTSKEIRYSNVLTPEFQYLSALISYSIQKHFNSDIEIVKPVMPDFKNWELPLGKFLIEHAFGEDEAVLLLLALAPHFHPRLLDAAIQESLNDSGHFPELGGVRMEGRNFRGFLPTGETALFILTDGAFDNRMEMQKLFRADYMLSKRKILWLEDVQQGEPVMSGKMVISRDYADTFLFGKPTPPHFSAAFPAKKVDETRDWSCLVINSELESQIGELKRWLKYNDALKDYGMNDKLPKGYRVLFHGPPGTGKTLTAGLLGNEMGKEVYKIDLSMVVSKYIGETEKNLELLFARAEDKGWILFFDEADALFGKRTNVRDAHDKYANQEVSYLLQRIEDFRGLIILATNMKSNIDDAFLRRFNSILKFPFPSAEERRLIWSKSFPKQSVFAHNSPGAKQLSILDEVKKFEIAGGNIINAVHYSCLRALERSDQTNGAEKNDYHGTNGQARQETGPPLLTILLQDILDGIQKELNKQGKPFSS